MLRRGVEPFDYISYLQQHPMFISLNYSKSVSSEKKDNNRSSKIAIAVSRCGAISLYFIISNLLCGFFVRSTTPNRIYLRTDNFFSSFPCNNEELWLNYSTSEPKKTSLLIADSHLTVKIWFIINNYECEMPRACKWVVLLYFVYKNTTLKLINHNDPNKRWGIVSLNSGGLRGRDCMVATFAMSVYRY